MYEPSVARAPGVEAVGPTLPAQPVASGPATQDKPIDHVVARREEHDRVELQAGGGATQAYAKFAFHPKSGAVSIKIVDARTDEVIREIPPESVIKMAEERQALARRPARPVGHPQAGRAVDGYA